MDYCEDFDHFVALAVGNLHKPSDCTSRPPQTTVIPRERLGWTVNAPPPGINFKSCYNFTDLLFNYLTYFCRESEFEDVGQFSATIRGRLQLQSVECCRFAVPKIKNCLIQGQVH